MSEFIPIPLSDQVLLRIVDPSGDEVTPGGIIIPQTLWREIKKGIVVAVGPGAVVPPVAITVEDDDEIAIIDRGPMTCQVGDTVLFQPSLGVPLDGRLFGLEGDYRCLREPEIRLIIARGQPALGSNGLDPLLH